MEKSWKESNILKNYKINESLEVGPNDDVDYIRNIMAERDEDGTIYYSADSDFSNYGSKNLDRFIDQLGTADDFDPEMYDDWDLDEDELNEVEKILRSLTSKDFDDNDNVIELDNEIKVVWRVYDRDDDEEDEDDVGDFDDEDVEVDEDLLKKIISCNIWTAYNDYYKAEELARMVTEKASGYFYLFADRGGIIDYGESTIYYMFDIVANDESGKRYVIYSDLGIHDFKYLCSSVEKALTSLNFNYDKEAWNKAKEEIGNLQTSERYIYSSKVPFTIE